MRRTTPCRFHKHNACNSESISCLVCLWAGICVCACGHACTNVCLYMRLRAYACVYSRMRMRGHVCMLVRICMRMCLGECACMDERARVNMHGWAHMCECTWMWLHEYVWLRMLASVHPCASACALVFVAYMEVWKSRKSLPVNIKQLPFITKQLPFITKQLPFISKKLPFISKQLPFIIKHYQQRKFILILQPKRTFPCNKKKCLVHMSTSFLRRPSF